MENALPNQFSVNTTAAAEDKRELESASGDGNHVNDEEDDFSDLSVEYPVCPDNFSCNFSDVQNGPSLGPKTRDQGVLAIIVPREMRGRGGGNEANELRVSRTLLKFWLEVLQRLSSTVSVRFVGT